LYFASSSLFKPIQASAKVSTALAPTLIAKKGDSAKESPFFDEAFAHTCWIASSLALLAMTK
jgi:hypothetical protein